MSVSKNKFTSFHLGLVLQMFWFFVCSTFHRCSTQKSCGYTWGLSDGKDGRRYIPAHDLCSSLSNITCQIVPSLHALTGCDSTSAFFQNWEKICLQNLENITWRVVWFGFTDQCWSWSYTECNKIAVSLLCYQKEKFKSCHHDLNMLRVKLATSKDASLSRIPPSDHPLGNTLMTSHLAKPPIRSPLDFGWQKGSNGLEPVLFTGMMSYDVTRLLARFDMKL